ncbi:winged helix DNA-binding domain-containing protein [Dyadobacter luteus]|uniref:Winged helix DNA-binding domain-containing protein n=1 Tax=Dyadobacter luteus TaxID=2259619 RepID=A0A3D8Y683_9BACT|nr:winged helix DNA-binding domain-containing protein [Dyadobacter luteus]REA58233.1 winged helix DNA-binding domain-containing protein [Dyadobacter luteus]
MKAQDIIRLRLFNQKLSKSSETTPAEIVSWFGAMQAQDFAGAKWSIGLRGKGMTEMDVGRAIAEKQIIRTWPMRGTLHFVVPEDVRWLLSLLAPRIISGAAGRHRQLELDALTFSKSQDILENALQGGKQLTRKEVYDILNLNGISTEGQRGIHIINYLAMKQVLCHGAHQDKQPTYALLDDWVPVGHALSTEESLHRVAVKYFQSHGPATLADFVWWTGLKISDARLALNSASPLLSSFEFNGQKYWFSSDLPDRLPAKNISLLPGFDELMLGYTDRKLLVQEALLPKIVPGNNGMFMPTIVINGKVEGLWKRTFKKDRIVIQLLPFDKIHDKYKDDILQAAGQFGHYLGTPIELC